MAKNLKYYNSHKKELDDIGIIKAIKIAGDYYKRGCIIEARDILADVVNAINQFDKEYKL